MEEITTSNRYDIGLSSLAALVVAGALVFLNLDGYHNEFPILDSFDDEPPAINWTHGWPLRCVVRSSIYATAQGISAPTPTSMAGTVGKEIGVSSRWPF